MLPKGRRREQLLAAINAMINQDFQSRVLTFDSPAAKAYAIISAERRAARRPIAEADCQISAISRATEAPISKIARSYLLLIGSLDWTKINPDIFGSMIQAVADEGERSALGMHYTSAPNILKVLNPLFLDDLRAQLEEAGDNPRKLLNLRNRMARIRVFDPACGLGNFLVIAYKEMRRIEAVINQRRGEVGRKTAIPKTNFRGIELRDFFAEIARLALIIAKFQCDATYREDVQARVEILPPNALNWVTQSNAPRLDWLSIFPPTGTGRSSIGTCSLTTGLRSWLVERSVAGQKH